MNGGRVSMPILHTELRLKVTERSSYELILKLSNIDDAVVDENDITLYMFERQA